MNKVRLKSLELRHPFFIQLWRRVLLVMLLVFWSVIEGLMGNQVWALLVGSIGIYSIYVFFFDFILPKEMATEKKDL